MIISCIVAVGKNYVIGVDNQMPWKISTDLKYFKKTTTGHCVIMGRKNFESIGKPLPDRTNIIVSRNKNLFISDCVIVDTIEKAIEYAHNENETEVFIIGGAEIYRQTIDYWDKIYITEVDINVKGDAFFPEIDFKKWKLESSTFVKKSQDVQFELNFKIYSRVISKP